MSALREAFIPKSWFSRLITLGLLLFILVNVVRGCLQNVEIEDHSAEVPGTLVRYERSGRSGSEAWFRYFVDGVPYLTTVQQSFKDCRTTGWCIGERYMVRYSSLHPEKAKVLLSEHLPRIDCAKAREGRFVETISSGRVTYIVRSATEQLEHTSSTTREVRLRVRWLDDCTYQLFDRRVTGEKESFPTKATDTLTVHITGVDAQGFDYEARATFWSDQVKGRQLFSNE